MSQRSVGKGGKRERGGREEGGQREKKEGGIEEVWGILGGWGGRTDTELWHFTS